MTTFRRTAPDVEAAQFVPTPEQPDAFTDRPEWLERLVEVRHLTFGATPEGHLYASLAGKISHALVHPGDWVVRNRDGHLSRVDAVTFAADYDLFPEPPAPAGAPTTTPAPVDTTAVAQ